MSYFVYILHSASIDKYYSGQTQELVGRLTRHNAGKFYQSSMEFHGKSFGVCNWIRGPKQWHFSEKLRSAERKDFSKTLNTQRYRAALERQGRQFSR